MKFFKQLIFAIAVVFSSLVVLPTYANTGLSLSQEDRIKAIMNEGKAQVQQEVTSEAQEWSKWGRNMGSAIVGVAQQMGLAVEQFSKTDVGKITIIAMVIKFMGPEMVDMATKLAMLVMIPLFTLLGLYAITRLRKSFLLSSTEYEIRPVLWGLYTKRIVTKQKYDRSINDHEAFITLAIGAVYGGCLVAMVIGLLR